MVRAIRGMMTFDDIMAYVTGNKNRLVFQDGDIEAGTWGAGQVMGLIHDIPSCKELLDRMVSEAREIVEGRLTKAFA